jgi:exo-1,4-beta-D-glucosaminidase
MSCSNRSVFWKACIAFLVCTAFSGLERLPAQTVAANTVALEGGWDLQSSAKVHAAGDVLSTSGYDPQGWMPISVPTTVVAALVKAKVYPDPTFGTNLRQLPGVEYPVGKNFSTIAMPVSSPFAVSWWYRKQFRLPAEARGRQVELHFEGINYRANIWLNGQRIADTSSVAGAWRRYTFDITRLVHPDRNNVIAVEVFAPTEKDLAITFVDWNPMPPDKDMGIFRKVSITWNGPVSLSNPAVFSQVNSPANDRAQLSITAQAKNLTDQPIQGVLRGSLGAVKFEQRVVLAPGESKDVNFEAADYPQLIMRHPELWWPTQMGSPHLYPLRLQFEVGGRISDATDTRVGIRQITSEVTSQTRRLFRINGKPLLIRGGGWSTDFLLREDLRRLNAELNYVQDMGLNTIRLEGRPETQEFYRETDRRGILVLAGWSCCDFWEQWPKWTPEDHSIAAESLRAQMYRLRGHPSILAWLNGSDNQPPPEQEQVYLGIEQELHWPDPTLSSATAKLGTGGAQNGVRMTGPYDYVPPSYWLEDREEDQPGHKCDLGGCGGAHGFNTETSSGPAIPPVESLRTMLGPDHVWPIDDAWRLHAGGGAFHELDNYTNALNARFGTARGVDDYAEKSQLMAYEGIRAMFEAYSRNKYESTGVIQWMLNNSWPSMIWHLYDYYLRPGGGYFGAKIAMQPLHPIYSSDDRSIWVVSSQYKDAGGLRLHATVYNLDMAAKFSRTVKLDASADSTQKVFALPEIQGLSPVYFLKLLLSDPSGKVVGSNFYWLSTSPETIDWSKSNWYTTPTLTLADYTALSQLPKVHLVVSERTRRSGDQTVTQVTIRNPSNSLAFAIRLKLDKGPRGEEILPALWEDNYFSLLPHESRDIAVTYATSQLGSAQPAIAASGWNTAQ